MQFPLVPTIVFLAAAFVSACGSATPSSNDPSQGTQCSEGDTKAADDGCNSCSCTEGGDWACTEMGCVDDSEKPTGSEAQCPAPVSSADACAQVIVWAASPDDGNCCRYATPCQAPKGWNQHGDEATCQAAK